MSVPILNLTWADVQGFARQVAAEFRHKYNPRSEPLRLYGIPNGGIHAAQAVLSHLGPGWALCNHPGEADAWVDDLYDSGATYRRYVKDYGDTPFAVLFNKPERGCTDWVSFPWERMQKQDGPQDNIRRLLQYIGEDPSREGLLETPDRVTRSYAEIFGGYKKDVGDLMKVFDGKGCDEMVLLKDIEFYSTCEHHMQPFFGRAHIAYLPAGKVIGVSKLARVLEVYSRRLQIQEKLTTDITAALDKYLSPLGSACVMEAQHFCMVCRGVGKQNSKMVTSSLTGAFKADASARAELFQLIRGS